MDIIFVRELRLEAGVGIYRRERDTRQTVQFDLEIGLPDKQPELSDKVTDTIDYAVVIERITAELATKHFGLVETLADHVAKILLDEFGAPWVKVSVAKLGALRNVKQVGVTIERSK
jgi:7,8-dihydroneopterin aldolase/epimerase/oxygenase